MHDAAGTKVLVVAAEAATRRVLRVALETDGFSVVEAPDGDAAREACATSTAIRGVVVDGSVDEGRSDTLDLTDATSGASVDAATSLAEELAGAVPEAVVVLHAAADRPASATGLSVVEDGDVAAVLDRFAPLRRRRSRADQISAAATIANDAGAITELWCELCRWDPHLPPQSLPARADEVLHHVADATTRPQPLGWGADHDVERAAVLLVEAAGSPVIAIEQLVCLRQALIQAVVPKVRPDEREELTARLHLIVDRAIGVAARFGAERLEREAYTDALTGLRNRRAFDRDVRSELHRADRYDRPLSVVALDVDGLKAVNDRDGHLAGDDLLRGVASALAQGIRSTDLAYRLGGDEFAVLLPETEPGVAEALVRRIAADAPPFTWGAAGAPVDGRDALTLLAVADGRLYGRRAARRRDRDRPRAS